MMFFLFDMHVGCVNLNCSSKRCHHGTNVASVHVYYPLPFEARSIKISLDLLALEKKMSLNSMFFVNFMMVDE